MKTKPKREFIRYKVTPARRRRLYWLKLKRFLLPPKSLPRDVALDQEVLSEIFQIAGRLSWAVVFLSAVLIVLQGLVFFTGNMNYLAATFERASLPSVIRMTLTSLGIVLLPVCLITMASSIASPRTKRSTKTSIAIILFTLTSSFLTVIPWYALLMLPVSYLFARAVTHTLKIPMKLQSPPTQITSSQLGAWGKENRWHEDVKMRILAQQALDAESLTVEQGNQLIGDMRHRATKIKKSPGTARLSAILLSGLVYVGLVLSVAPQFSAVYMVKTDSGTSIGYVLRGPNDVLLIDQQNRSLQLYAEDAITWMGVCGRDSDMHWLFKPVVLRRKEGELDCSI